MYIECIGTNNTGDAMPQLSHPSTRMRTLRFVLMLAAAHSFATGVGLILQPEVVIHWGGWNRITEPFFPAQGGVFHILMALLYLEVARREHYRVVLPFIILVKATATVFLFTYVLTVETVWLAAISGAVDGSFALILYRLYRGTHLDLENG